MLAVHTPEKCSRQDTVDVGGDSLVPCRLQFQPLSDAEALNDDRQRFERIAGTRTAFAEDPCKFRHLIGLEQVQHVFSSGQGTRLPRENRDGSRSDWACRVLPGFQILVVLEEVPALRV